MEANQSPSEYLLILIDILKLDKLFQREYKIERECGRCGKLYTNKDVITLGLVDDFKELFLSSTTVEDFNCNHCKNKVNMCEVQKLQKINGEGIIVLCLNKYLDKKLVSYPLKFIVDNETYFLKSTIEHYGISIHGGHYVCRIVDENSYCLIDDMKVIKYNENISPDANTYMLFYEKLI